MQRSAVTLARVIGFIESYDLLSGVKTPVSEIIRKIAEHYAFEKLPTTLEELDVKKGVEFHQGASAHGPIQKFTIFDTGVVIDTHVDTDACAAILDEILNWGATEFGINYKANSIQRFAYVSNLTFYSEASLLDIHPAIEYLKSTTSELLRGIWGEELEYSPTGLTIGHDPTIRRFQVAPFRIERRAETRFSENKYFSEAPLPTSIHWTLLEEYERRVIEGRQ